MYGPGQYFFCEPKYLSLISTFHATFIDFASLGISAKLGFPASSKKNCILPKKFSFRTKVFSLQNHPFQASPFQNIYIYTCKKNSNTLQCPLTARVGGGKSLSGRVRKECKECSLTPTRPTDLPKQGRTPTRLITSLIALISQTSTD